jgi:diguanylate cyclase
MIFEQVFEMVNMGIVILDNDLKVHNWNRWMEIHSKIKAEEIIGAPLFSFFPELNNKSFQRNFRAVLKFGNFCFFSQKLHKYLFPFKAANMLGANFEFMQQSCTMGPIRDRNNIVKYIYVMVQDVTDVAAYEQKLLEMNIKDALTEVYNRRYLESRLKQDFELHRRYKKKLSLIMLDIDKFKNINDNYGHQCGDFILKRYALLLKSSFRKVDILARYGGEEFCCVMPETGLNQAVVVAERIRRTTQDTAFDFKGKRLNITVSQGVAELSFADASAEFLIKKADKALYIAKERGRNRVITANQ